MGTVETFINSFDLSNLLYYLVRALAAFLCIVIHEMSHGYAALALGDQTAKRSGRLSFNPLHHIDPLGLLLMITAGFGWAKPVPVDMRRFKHPKQGMALTALAGPVSNFILALIALGGASLLYHYAAFSSQLVYEIVSWFYVFLLYMAILSVGLGVFNLFPIPPLDGSKVLFSLLPNRLYDWLMHYERYIGILLFALVFLGWLDAPLYAARTAVLTVLCHLVGLPEGIVT
ncbi:MAG: site-2 protease family protein [Clostridiales bacterium]|nr:site-2 protease family protein [Clostridiales bacterium]